jgi:hypothetical protein
MNEKLKMCIMISLVFLSISGIAFYYSYTQLQQLQQISATIEPQVKQLNIFFNGNHSSFPNLPPQGLTYWTVSAWGKDYYYPTTQRFSFYDYNSMHSLSMSIDVSFTFGSMFAIAGIVSIFIPIILIVITKVKVALNTNEESQGGEKK